MTTQKSPTTKNPLTAPNTGMAFLAYIIFFIPLLTEAKNDPFVIFHVKQSTGLFILAIIGSLFNIIPILGWIVSAFISLFIFILWIIGVVNALSGKKELLPVIGQYANDKINF